MVRDKTIYAKSRRILALFFIVGITLLFLDFTGSIHAWLGWMAKIQFLPALMALNVVVVIILIAMTLLFGRIYCSVICPLGVMQDGISWLSGLRKKKKKSFLIFCRGQMASICGIGDFYSRHYCRNWFCCGIIGSDGKYGTLYRLWCL